MVVKEILGEVKREGISKKYKSEFLILAKGNKEESFKIFKELKKYYVGLAIRNKNGRIEQYIRCSNCFDKYEEAQKYRKYLILNVNDSLDYLTVDFLYSIYDYECPLNEYEKKNFIIIKDRV